MTFKTCAATGLFALILLAPTSNADAAIKCDGPYQINSAAGGRIATPYCQDNYLASIARAAGMRVSNKTIRQNPNRKQEACRFVGHDPRVQNICAGYIFDGGGRR